MTQENNITNNIDLDQAHKMAKGLAVRFGCLPEFKAHEYEEFLQLKEKGYLPQQPYQAYGAAFLHITEYW